MQDYTSPALNVRSGVYGAQRVVFLSRNNKPLRRGSMYDKAKKLKEIVITKFSQNPLWLPIFLACFIGVLIQLNFCIMKLVYPFVDSHVKMELEDMPILPSFTFCYMMPYDVDKLKERGFQFNPNYVLENRKYPGVWNWQTLPQIDNLTELFFSVHSEFTIEPFDNLKKWMTVETTIFSNKGRCYTFHSLNLTMDRASDADLFGFYLKAPAIHRKYVQEDQLYFEKNFKLKYNYKFLYRTDGWLVFVNDRQENFRELSYTSHMREKIFVRHDELLMVKLSETRFDLIPGVGVPCNNKPGYNRGQCGYECRSAGLSRKYPCNSPFLVYNESLPFCRDPLIVQNMSRDMRDMLKLVITSKGDDCTCFDRCKYSDYRTSIESVDPVDVNSSSDTPIESRMTIKFTMGKVTQISEQYSYSFSKFVAEIGGSAGVLLNFSVIGVAGIPIALYHFIKEFWLRKFIKPRRKTIVYDNAGIVTRSIRAPVFVRAGQ